MCQQVIERYRGCNCIYHKHAFDPCNAFGSANHDVSCVVVHVDLICPEHQTPGSSIETEDATNSSNSLQQLEALDDESLSTGFTPRISDDVWKSHSALIEILHAEGKSDNEILKILANERSLKLMENQLRTRMTQWNLFSTGPKKVTEVSRSDKSPMKLQIVSKDSSITALPDPQGSGTPTNHESDRLSNIEVSVNNLECPDSVLAEIASQNIQYHTTEAVDFGDKEFVNMNRTGEASKSRNDDYFNEKTVLQQLMSSDIFQDDHLSGGSLLQRGKRRRQAYEEDSDDSILYLRQDESNYSTRESSSSQRSRLAANAIAGIGAAEILRRHHDRRDKSAPSDNGEAIHDRGDDGIIHNEYISSIPRHEKGYIPKFIEMRCSHRDCNKIFHRKCDLTKHEKTHSRPYKCPFITCRYHDVGLPTEREKERHINDKHSPNAKLYHCNFCDFCTKRESNRRQHMEKKHGWEDLRKRGTRQQIDSGYASTKTSAGLAPAPPLGLSHQDSDGEFDAKLDAWLSNRNSFLNVKDPWENFLHKQDASLQSTTGKTGLEVAFQPIETGLPEHVEPYFDSNDRNEDQSEMMALQPATPESPSDVAQYFRANARATTDLPLEPIEKQRLSNNGSTELSVLESIHDFASSSQAQTSTPTSPETSALSVAALKREEKVQVNHFAMLTRPSESERPSTMQKDDIIDGDDEGSTLVHSQAASVLSFPTIASTNTAYSISDLISATRELIQMFTRDEFFRTLYHEAIDDSRIDSERVTRNFGRLLAVYGTDLKEEAEDSLQYTAARLVQHRAKHVARSIQQVFERELCQSTQKTLGDNLSLVGIVRDNEESDDDQTRYLEDSVGNLTPVIDFLRGGNAFQKLKEDFQKFVRPHVQHSQSQVQNHGQAISEPDTSDRNSQKVSGQSKLDSLTRTWPTKWRNKVLQLRVWLGEVSVLEPIIKDKYQRIRWTCNCGTEIYDDYQELKHGALATLQRRLAVQRKLAGSYMIELVNCGTDQSSSLSSCFTGLKEMFTHPQKSIFGGKFRNSGDGSCLPQHNLKTTTSCANSPAKTLVDDTAYILACIRAERQSNRLHHNPVGELKVDRDLFCSLKSTYMRQRGRLYNLLSLQKLAGVHFVKFGVLQTEYVDIRHHFSSCQSSCMCLPPKEKIDQAEYECTPIPPEVSPPIGPNLITHLISNPCCIPAEQTWMLKQMPKKLKGRLEGKLDENVTGWGLHFDESLNWTKIWAILFVVFVLGSFSFAILWSVYRFDIQGAFGVASWWISLCTVLLGILATKDMSS